MKTIAENIKILLDLIDLTWSSSNIECPPDALIRICIVRQYV